MTSKNWNINNVSVNFYLSPLFVLLQYLVIRRFYPSSNIGESILISLFVYIFSSMFFQPDLDQHPNKPGKETFPLGSYLFPIFAEVLSSIFFMSKKKARKLLYNCLIPINRAWFYLWMPYGVLLTHRGISHLPLIGVLSRVIYLKLLTYFFNYGYINDFGIFLDNFFFWNLNGSYLTFIIYCLPVYLSDFFHILIDFLESKVKGFDFCPPKIPRGLIARLFGRFKK